MTENVVDMTTRKSVKPESPEDATTSQWFDLWKKYAKNEGLETFMIVAIAKDKTVRYEIRGVNELHLSRLYRECDSMKEVITDQLDYQEDDVELTADDDDEDEE